MPTLSPVSAEAKKRWRNSVIAARKSISREILESPRSAPRSASGDSSRQRSLMQVATAQGVGRRKEQDAYERSKAVMTNPVPLSASVGVSAALQSEGYYQQSVSQLRRQDNARRLRDAMSRVSVDPISDAAEKHAFHQKHILAHRRDQEMERRRAMFDSMVGCSLPASVTMPGPPRQPERRAQPHRTRQRMPHQPLVVPGANFIPDDVLM